MIEGYFGRPGSGKTYSLVRRALREMKAGYDVFANFPLEGATMFGPEDLLDLPPGFICVDESHLWFPSRQSLSLPASWMAQLSQTRKSGWHLLYSAQHPRRVDKALRDVTHWAWWCAKWSIPGLGPYGPLIFVADMYDPDQGAMEKNPHSDELRIVRKWSRFRMKTANAYDTFGSVEVAKHTVKDSDVYLKAKRDRDGENVATVGSRATFDVTNKSRKKVG